MARVLALSSLALATSVALAVGPQTWVQAGAVDFGAGESATVSVDRSGDLVLAPLMEQLLEAPEPRVWSVAVSPDGDVYVSVGERGRVLRLGGEGQEPTTVFEAAELSAQAMAFGPDGHLYVAAGPRGGIYRVPADHDGSPLAPWYAPDTVYVWDLLFDDSGTLFVATGGDGKILAVSPEADAEVLYDSPEPHVTTLALDGAGNLLAGTEGSGYVYRIGPDGDVFVLYDAPVREITDLLVAHDSIWAAGFGAADDEVADERADAPPASRNGGEEGGGGAVFRIAADGYARQTWSAPDAGAYALGELDGQIVAGTGDQGRLVRVGPDGETGLVGRLQGAQVVALAALADGGLLAATSNVGRLYALRPGHRPEGEFLSAVKDTGTISRWGALRWHATAPAGTSVAISTRSGNTAVPDDTWSDWSADRSEDSGAIVESPPARFLQWRARLATTQHGTTPALHRVEVAFVTRNLPPEMGTVTVHPGGVVYRQSTGFEEGLPFAQLPQTVQRALRETDAGAASGAPAGRAFLGRPLYIAGLRTFSWEATDANADALTYSVEFRGEAEEIWRPLTGPAAETVFVLDSRRLADGTYVVRVTASDLPSNATEEALTDAAVSRAFLVDNTPPEIRGLRAEVAADGATLRGSVQDVTSLVGGLQYSVDGADWRTVSPVDGVADTPAEEFEIHIEGLSAGEHVVVVRATDSALNGTAAKVVFTIR